MAARTWILASLALAAVVPAACQSVDVRMPEPKYATRTEDLPYSADRPGGWEEAAENADPGSIRVVPAKPRYATRMEDARTSPDGPGEAAPADRAAAPASTRTGPVRASAEPSVRREAIETEALPPLDADDQPPERGLDTPPARRAPEPAAQRPAQPASPAPAPADRAAATAAGTYRYVVQAGDTVAGIGRRFGVRAQAIIELNGLEPRGGIRAGQALYLPLTARDRGDEPYATGPAPAGMSRAADYREPAAPSAPSTTAAAAAPNLPPPAQPMPVAATPEPGAVAARGRGRFIWPVRGDILARFGSAGTGLRNDGVNIGAPEGTSVKAAAAGEVVYAGSVIAAFGNMVLIKHADGWVTAYGHLSRIDVKMRDQVTQGQIIGAVGSSGGVPQPQLHFEIRFAPSPREKAAPVDPLPILR